MKTILLQRLPGTINGTFGVLIRDDGFPWLTTVERPWDGNKENVSCIPAGTYTARKIMSPKRKYNVFEIQSVPGRTAIEMHIANTMNDVEGCIGIGKSFGEVGVFPEVMFSTVAFQVFMEYLNGDDSFTLRIIDPK